jgi:GH15 family glucan-1,4-alpha-glucosidase
VLDDSNASSIGEYALIGDTRTAALVSPDGSIDWFCLPRFDGDPVFGSLVDRSGGRFALGVVDGEVESRAYRDQTASVETAFRSSSGGASLVDGMVLDASSSLRPQMLLVRQLRCTDGAVRARLEFDPRRGLPGRPMRLERRSGSVVAVDGPLALALRTQPEVPLDGPAHVLLRAGEALTATLFAADRQPLVLVSPHDAIGMLAETERWWRSWCGGVRYRGPRFETVLRSLITLRLLTYAPSGAPVAAPTTSIPAPPGSERAWDYRYSWPRDASMGIRAFLSLRGMEEPAAWLRWLRHATQNTRPRVNVLLTLDGRPVPDERTIDDVDTGLVRIGNGAADQHQLDVYGYIADAVWAMADTGLERATARLVGSFADFVADRWSEPDSGIWEMRTQPAHHVHSKVMAWVALDRALRLADRIGARTGRARRWRHERDTLAAQVRARGFDRDRGTYVGTYGSRELDASLLRLSGLGFEDPGSSRIAGTVEAVRRELGAGGALLYRYRAGIDGLEGGESAFVACSFWLAQALSHLGRVEEAAHVFEELCDRATPLGLYAEQIEPTTGHHQGNFPQALSHAALLETAAGFNEDPGNLPAEPRTRHARAE